MLSAILALGLATTVLLLAWSLLISRTQDGYKDRIWDQSVHLMNVQILRILLDWNEFRYLQCSLPRKDLENCFRKRVRLTLEMLWLVEENTNSLIQWAHTSKSANDSQRGRRGDDLLAAAIQLRMNLLLARCCLYLQWLFPLWRLLPEWVKPYRHLLNCLEHWRLKLSISCM